MSEDFYYVDNKFNESVTSMSATGERMQWSTTPPTAPGWYWVKRLRRIELVEVERFEHEGGMGVVVNGYKLTMPEVSYAHWLGPLPEPEAPKGDT